MRKVLREQLGRDGLEHALGRHRARRERRREHLAEQLGRKVGREHVGRRVREHIRRIEDLVLRVPTRRRARTTPGADPGHSLTVHRFSTRRRSEIPGRALALLRRVLHGRMWMSEARAQSSLGHAALPVRRRRGRGAARASRRATTTGARRGASPRARRIRTRSSRRRRGARRSKRPGSRSTGRSSISDTSTTRDRRSACTRSPRRRRTARRRGARRGKSTKSEFIEITRARRIIHPDQAALLDRLAASPRRERRRSQVLRRPRPERVARRGSDTDSVSPILTRRSISLDKNARCGNTVLP